MAEIAIVYWSGTGNTEAMANLVAEGVKSAGKDADVISAENFSVADASKYTKFAFGCPSMGEEILEEDVFEPMFASIESSLSGKTVGLFGSYGWGDGQWMRDWVDRCKAKGANVVGDVIANEYPGDAESADCKALGAKVAA